MIGKRNNKITIIEKIGTNKHRHILWKYKCDCGNFGQITTNSFNDKRSNYRSCGNCDINELIGKKFNKLTIKKYIGKDNIQNKYSIYECLCDCGKIVNVRSCNLKSGTTKSCGCYFNYNSEHYNSDQYKTHGMSYTSEYNIWSGMIQRCYNKSKLNYYSYGAIGVKVCDRWRFGENGKNGFECFYEDMGKRPSKEYSLDRYPNCEGDYELDNCRWATQIQQINNRINTIWVNYKGEKLSLKEASIKSGIKYNTLYTRLKKKQKLF